MKNLNSITYILLKCLHRKKIVRQIEDIREQNKNDNWDGYGAVAITPEAAKNAQDFIKKLLENSKLDLNTLRLIEVEPENYGNIAFDWFKDHDHQISISVESNKTITYVYAIGEDKGGEKLPINKDLLSTIDLLIKRIYGS